MIYETVSHCETWADWHSLAMTELEKKMILFLGTVSSVNTMRLARYLYGHSGEYPAANIIASGLENQNLLYRRFSTGSSTHVHVYSLTEKGLKKARELEASNVHP